MNTCLTNSMCGNKRYYYMQWCNYNYNGYEYTPHPTNTCTRPNITDTYSTCTMCWKFMDCCADNIDDCCIPSETTVPTSFPTSMPTLMCGLGRNYYYEKGKEECFFFEKSKQDISYYTEHSLVCCSGHRDECCEIRDEYYYGILASFILIICIFMHVFLKNNRKSRNTVRPELT